MSNGKTTTTTTKMKNYNKLKLTENYKMTWHLFFILIEAKQKKNHEQIFSQEFNDDCLAFL